MKPDYQIKNVRLYNVDCMLFMKETSDNYYELAINNLTTSKSYIKMTSEK